MFSVSTGHLGYLFSAAPFGQASAEWLGFQILHGVGVRLHEAVPFSRQGYAFALICIRNWESQSVFQLSHDAVICAELDVYGLLVNNRDDI